MAANLQGTTVLLTAVHQLSLLPLTVLAKASTCCLTLILITHLAHRDPAFQIRQCIYLCICRLENWLCSVKEAKVFKEDREATIWDLMVCKRLCIVKIMNPGRRLVKKLEKP